MAGGEGKALAAAYKALSQTHASCQGKPMLEILLERCKAAGFC